MIFVGDIALPKEAVIGDIALPGAFKATPVIANLEGAITADHMASVSGNHVFNNDIVMKYLKKWNVKGVILANNHITDVPQAFKRTKEILTECGIMFCGAGFTDKEASNPMWLGECGNNICILAYGWDVISCRKPHKGKAGANLLKAKQILKSITVFKEKYPEKLLYLVMHWDIELERYPMPAHRKLARKMIEAGADAVIGHHPHCIQAYEVYKGKPVFYSLGNWLFPHGIFCNGRISFPKYSNKEFAVDIKPEYADVYSFTFNPADNSLRYNDVKRIKYDEGTYISACYLGLSDDEYFDWFKANRQKTKGIPVYGRYDRCFENTLKDNWIKLRQVAVRRIRKYFRRSGG